MEDMSKKNRMKEMRQICKSIKQADKIWRENVAKLEAFVSESAKECGLVSNKDDCKLETIRSGEDCVKIYGAMKCPGFTASMLDRLESRISNSKFSLMVGPQPAHEYSKFPKEKCLLGFKFIIEI